MGMGMAVSCIIGKRKTRIWAGFCLETTVERYYVRNWCTCYCDGKLIIVRVDAD